MNEIILSGILGRIEMKTYGPEQKVLANFSVAVKPRKDSETLWMKCVAFDYSAQSFEKYGIKVGDLILVKGMVDQDTYTDKTGQQKQAMKLVIQKIQKLYKPVGSGSYEVETTMPEPHRGVPDLDDIPF